MKESVLVTGGAGFIGSHTCVELLMVGYRVVVIDSLDNSCAEALNRVKKITGATEDDLVLEVLDLLDLERLQDLFNRHCKKPHRKFTSCIHFAGFKAVGESVQKPLHYYMNNFTATMNLVNLLDQHGCHSLVFSSSCTVYGEPDSLPISESHMKRPTNPYGHSKLMVEQMLRDLNTSASRKWSIALLRYFNPIGAHKSGLIGEDPSGIPNNLLPFICQVAVGKRDSLTVFGNDWDSRDGTGVSNTLKATTNPIR